MTDDKAFFESAAAVARDTRANPKAGKALTLARSGICFTCPSVALRDGPGACKTCGQTRICTHDARPVREHVAAGQCPEGRLEIPAAASLDFSLSDRCNLKCPACYAAGGYGAGPDLERTRRTISWFIEQARPRTASKFRSLNIYGGEPLLEWDDLCATVDWAAETWPEFDLGFTAVTNMTLLTPERLDWLISHKVTVSPSIDGNPEAERRSRGSFAASVVFDNAKMLLARQGARCRMTVTPENAELLADSVAYLCEEVGFRTVNAVMAGGVAWGPAALTAMEAQITRLTDWWIDHVRHGRWFGLYHIENMWRGLSEGQRRRSLCAAGTGRVAVDTQGRLWPCHRFCNPGAQEDYCLGTLASGYTNLKLYYRLRHYDLAYDWREHCATCPAVLGCHYFCLWENMAEKSAAFLGPASYTCRIWRHYWREALRAYALLTAEKHLVPQAKRRITMPEKKAPNG